MSLRVRLALTLVVLVVPFAIGLVVLQNHWLHRTTAQSMAESMRERADAGAIFRCERNPDLWPRNPRRRGRRGRGGRPFAYNTAGDSANPNAPILEASFVRSVVADGVAWSLNDHGGLRVGTLVAEDGPCAILVVQRPARFLRVPMWPALLIVALAVLIAVLAAGPLVRRIRKLTDEVHRAGETGKLAVDQRGDELGELSRALSGDREKLREQMAALRARDESLTAFVANTTHDVMIPLTVLQGHLVKLRDRLEDGSAARTTTELALEEADYLGALMRNLGIAARLDAGDRPLEKIEVDVVALIERVVARHSPIAKQTSVSLDHAVPDELSIVADLTLMEQLVSNLVHNAVRYNEAGGHVAVVLERVDERFRIRVMDDGPGVPAEELKRLGERRFRGNDARTRQTKGSGLGLSIASDVAARHGWTLRFDANEPNGLVVTLEGEA